MATIGETLLTFPDLAKRLKQGGTEQISAIIEVLNETNPFMDDMPVMQCNNGTAHRTTIRTGLPEVFWRSINQGVPISKSETAQIDDKTGELGVWSFVDATLANLNGNRRDFMMSEEKAFMEALNQEMAKTVIYGNTQENDAKFTGLAPRFSTLSDDPTNSGYNVIDAGGAGATNTSLWLVHWGDVTAHGIYPAGIPAGIKRTHYESVPITDRDGNDFIGHKTHYAWNLGITVRDWRYIVRVANLDTAQLADIIDQGAATAAQQKLIRLMLKAHSQIPNPSVGKAAWYMNRTAKLMIDIMAAEKSNVNLTIENFEGKPVTTFYGVPVRQCDAIRSDEVAVA